jgi:transposase
MLCNQERKDSIQEKKNRMEERDGGILNRVNNLKRDMYWKLVRETVQEYKHILISRFHVSKLVKKIKRSTQKDVELEPFYILSKAETQSQGIWSRDS